MKYSISITYTGYLHALSQKHALSITENLIDLNDKTPLIEDEQIKIMLTKVIEDELAPVKPE